jgi:PhnB protein
MAKAKSAIPEGFHTVTPQLTLDNAAEAIEWYKKAFGAKENGRAVGPDGRILHAELRIGNSPIMVNDDMMGGPKATPNSRSAFWIYVDDVDTLYNRAVSAGAKVSPSPMGKLADQFWGDRTGTIIDPQGFQWTLATRKEDLTREEMDKRQAEWMKSFAPQPTHS